MEHLLTSMRVYLHETEEAHNLLNMQCQGVKTSLNRLQRRSATELHLREEEETMKEEESFGLNCFQMDEIDILIKKAEQVLVDDILTTKNPKKNNKIVNDKSNSNDVLNPLQKCSSKVGHSTKQNTGKANNRDGSVIIKKLDSKKEKRKGFTEQKSGSQTQKSKRSTVHTQKQCTRERFLTEVNLESIKNNEKLLSTREKPIEKEKNCHEGTSETKITQLSGTKITQPALLPPLYDPTFKVEYCNARKQKRELSKLQNNGVVMQQNKKAVDEFMSSLRHKSDDIKVENELDMNTIAKLLHSGLTEVQRREMLESIYDVRSVACNTIRNESERRLALFSYDDNNNNDDIKPTSTMEMKSLLKLAQLKYNVTVSGKIRSLFENEFSEEECDVEKKICQFRNLYYLVNGRRPSFVKNE